MISSPKKLIEVALPLEAINKESAREKSIRHGHPSTLHLWWSRKPLATCRAVLFAQLVDDPSSHPEQFPTEEAQERERQRLFRIIEELVKWENSNNERVLEAARVEIQRSCNGNPPPVLDPFCGGGSIPLEAQRLGLEAYAGDLNPVAVLITKALIEIPPKFANRPPVHLGAQASRLPHRGWYSRGYLPHFDQPGLVQMITFRLHDALPATRRTEWEELLKIEDDATRREKIEAYLDAGYGSCSLRDERIARLVEEALLHFDGQRYRLLAWVIMPNHVHVLTEVLPGHPLAEVVHSWKSFTAKEANAIWGRSGAFWQPEYFDRFIRDEQHLANAIRYIHDNPVKAGFVQRAEEWPYSSASEIRKKASETLALPGIEREWRGARGLAEDVRYYGQWMRDEAEKRIGYLYPKVKLPKERGGGEATVIAWLYCRAVKCPNPACGAMMPLASKFWLSTKKGKKAWVEPVVDKQAKTVRFQVKTGEGMPPDPPKIGRGATFRCLTCGQVADKKSVRAEFQAKRNNAKLMAIVAEGARERVYLPSSEDHIAVAASARPRWRPEEEMNQDTSNLVSGRGYGITRWHEIFTPRQLVALTTFSDLVSEAWERVLADARKAGMPDDGKGLNDGGTGATAYADAVATYFGMGLSRLSDICNSLCRWETSKTQVRNLFGRQAIPMIWDFAEPNIFAEAAGDFGVSLGNLAKALEATPCSVNASARQLDAATNINGVTQPLISTDPPYYDNIGYADLSDFFYIWLRRSLGKVYPDLFSTLLVPKAQELVATPYRFDGDREKAQRFFEEGLSKAFAHMREAQHPDYPLTVFYAFKQAEDEEGDDGSAGVSPASEEEDQGGQDGRAPRRAPRYAPSHRTSTGWETMLEGLLKAGFTITGTWPMRSELSNRPVASGTNALASSIVLVCRPRPENAQPTTRREFLTSLKRELPDALKHLQHGNIAPVDLAQATIGPGMAVFSRYARVLEADGKPMRVRTALALINQTLDEVLTEQEGEFDADTRWAVAWFEQFGFEEGPFGVAETLSKAKNTAVSGMVEAGILTARAGKVRLLRRDELATDWDPARDRRLPVWEVTQHLIRSLEREGESGAARLLTKLGEKGELARDLAYRLYTTCERKKWAQDALAFNSLVVSWLEISRLAAQKPEGQRELFS